MTEEFDTVLDEWLEALIERHRGSHKADCNADEYLPSPIEHAHELRPLLQVAERLCHWNVPTPSAHAPAWAKQEPGGDAGDEDYMSHSPPFAG